MKRSELIKQNKEILVTIIMEMYDERQQLVNKIKDLERRIPFKTEFGDRSCNERLKKIRRENG